MNAKFDEPNFAYWKLEDLAKSYLGLAEEVTGLPAFQRGAVWQEWRVEALWDSIFSYFPIGAILLAQSEEFDFKAIHASEKLQGGITNNESSRVKYVVVDGQQRMDAISLGFIDFQKDIKYRLWIDLGGPKDKTQKMFDFFVCTQENPFGANLTKAEKRNAAVTIKSEYFDDSELSLYNTYPFKAKLPVPFVEFTKLILNNSWEEIVNKLFEPDTLNISKDVSEILKIQKNNNLNDLSIVNLIIETIRNVMVEDPYKVPIIFIQKSPLMTIDRLGKLFERININGVAPSQAELFFSALKLKEPKFSDYVSRIRKDKEIGGLLKPAEIVLSAFRLANYEIGELNLSQFDVMKDKYIKIIDEEIFASHGSSESIYLKCFKKAYQTIKFTGENNDIGFPAQLIGRIRPRTWQTLLYWFFLNQESIQPDFKVSADIRLNMLRYVMFDLMNFYLSRYNGIQQFTSHPSFSKLQCKKIKENYPFPALDIYQETKRKILNGRESTFFSLLTPEQYHKKISNEDDSLNPNWFSLVYEDILLLYAQRQYLSEWEDNDIDLDHIIPAAWMYFAGNKSYMEYWPEKNMNYEQTRSQVREFRWTVMDSVGNKRYWPEVLNRSNQDISPNKKFIRNEVDDILNDSYHHYRLKRIGDILDASFIERDEVDKWITIENPDDDRNWNDENRLLKFKRAVEKRRYLIYKEAFESLKLSDWIASS